jgi:hypothetical protein
MYIADSGAGHCVPVFLGCWYLCRAVIHNNPVSAATRGTPIPIPSPNPRALGTVEQASVADGALELVAVCVVEVAKEPRLWVTRALLVELVVVVPLALVVVNASARSKTWLVDCATTAKLTIVVLFHITPMFCVQQSAVESSAWQHQALNWLQNRKFTLLSLTTRAISILPTQASRGGVCAIDYRCQTGLTIGTYARTAASPALVGACAAVHIPEKTARTDTIATT